MTLGGNSRESCFTSNIICMLCSTRIKLRELAIMFTTENYSWGKQLLQIIQKSGKLANHVKIRKAPVSFWEEYMYDCKSDPQAKKISYM